VVVAIEKMHSGMKDELQDLRAENEALRKEVNGLRRDHRASTTATRDAITKGASGGGGGLVRLPMPSTSNRRSA
jgi:cell division protein FtsB